MQSKAHFENTKDIELTMEFTMTLEDWNALLKTMDDKWPAWDFKNKIQTMIYNAEKQISDKTEV